MTRRSRWRWKPAPSKLASIIAAPNAPNAAPAKGLPMPHRLRIRFWRLFLALATWLTDRFDGLEAWAVAKLKRALAAR